MGSQKMVEILTRWTHGGISESQFAADLKLVDDLSAAMSQTSICGLGQIVPRARAIRTENISARKWKRMS